jgi:Fe-S cluster assembly protein SufD
MSTLVTSGFTSAAFEAFIAARHEPQWLGERRRAAWKLFEALPMPSRADEEWMRTDIRLLRLDRFGFPLEPVVTLGAAPEALLKQGVDLAGYTSASDSRLVEAEIDQTLRQKGVRFGSLEEIAREEKELVERHLFRAFDPAYDRFAALHAAAWSGGTMLYVPKGVVIDRPLHTLSTISEGGVDTSHLLVVLDEGAEATLLSETGGGGDAGLHCGAIELILKPGAKLRYVNLQNWSTGVWHFAHQKAAVGRDAQLQWTIGALGSRLAKVNQHVSLVGSNAQTQVNGVMFTEGKQHLTYNTLQHHEAPACKSDLLYKGALQDKSRLVWRGMIKVDVGAQKTDGYQRNDSLMLSDEARADSIPGLEIEADDVRCTHGATAGRVDEESIFYLRTRGLTRNEAIRTYVSGFFQQVFDRITIESVRNALGEAIGRRIREYN